MAKFHIELKRGLSLSKTLTSVNVPCYSSPFVGQAKGTTELANGIRDLFENPKKGFLLVNGPAGIGKTRLVSQYLSKQTTREFLEVKFGLRFLLWLNCARFSDGHFTEQEFCAELAKMARKAVADPNGIFPDFSSILHHFLHVRGQKIAFVLDNATNCDLAVLEIFKSVPAILICDDDKVNEIFADYVRSPVVTVPPMSKEELYEVVGLDEKSDAMRRILLKSGFSPMYSKLLKPFALEVCDKPKRFPASIQDCVISIVQNLSDSQLNRLCVFLFHGTETPISITELSILWGTESSDRIEEQIEEFVSLNLISRIQYGDESCAVMHQLIKRTGVQFESIPKLKSYLSSPNNLTHVALLTAIKFDFVKPTLNDVNVDLHKSVLKIFSQVISLNRQDLLERFLKKPLIARYIFEKYPEAARMTNINNETVYIIASKVGSLEIVKLVYEKYHEAAKVRDKRFGMLPISWAISSKAPLDVVRFAFHTNPNSVKVPSKVLKQTPLCTAALYGDFNTARYIFERYNDAIHVEDSVGRLPISAAAENGNLTLVKYLYDRFPDGLASTIPLRLAAARGHLPVAKFLHSKFPKAASVVDEVGLLPGNLASMNGYEDVANFLLTA